MSPWAWLESTAGWHTAAQGQSCDNPGARGVRGAARSGPRCPGAQEAHPSGSLSPPSVELHGFPLAARRPPWRLYPGGGSGPGPAPRQASGSSWTTCPSGTAPARSLLGSQGFPRAIHNAATGGRCDTVDGSGCRRDRRGLWPCGSPTPDFHHCPWQVPLSPPHQCSCRLQDLCSHPYPPCPSPQASCLPPGQMPSSGSLGPGCLSTPQGADALFRRARVAEPTSAPSPGWEL